ncbi:MAG TPA: helix-turn-helix domain-containing protein [Casimicrobiaceae bacterium]
MTARTHRLGLTTSEAARHLGVSLSTIRRWSDMGYLRGYRTPGGQRRFSIEQLDEFLDSLESGGAIRQAESVADAPAGDEPTFTAETVFRADPPADEERRFEPRPSPFAMLDEEPRL